jgi:hypothetical protein
MLAHQPCQLERGDLGVPAEHLLQCGIHMDQAFILGIL